MLRLFLLIGSLFLSVQARDNESEGLYHRTLADITTGGWNSNRRSGKMERMQKILLKNIDDKPYGMVLNSLPEGAMHNISSSNVVFTTAMVATFLERDHIRFVGTLRQTGFSGDIVVAILPNTNPSIVKRLVDYRVVIYEVPIKCAGNVQNILCSSSTSEKTFSLSVLRHALYQSWVLMYAEDAQVMISDFRDVFFQTNPFNYHSDEWSGHMFQLVVFQEMFPNRVISRCPVNSGLINACYGSEALKMIGTNTISCSGTVFGTRNAIAVYSYLIVQQSDPRVRLGRNSTATAADLQKADRSCISNGVDQGFHNWLLYSGILNKYMDVKIYQQGEGMVNTLGGFYGEKKLLRAALSEWKVLRGESPYKYVYNWNGDRSPVVHQIDRFLTTELINGYNGNLAVFQLLK